jgi:hypothetical protein
MQESGRLHQLAVFTKIHMLKARVWDHSPKVELGIAWASLGKSHLLNVIREFDSAKSKFSRARLRLGEVARLILKKGFVGLRNYINVISQLREAHVSSVDDCTKFRMIRELMSLVFLMV